MNNPFKMHLNITNKNANGEIISHWREEAHSWTRNGYMFMMEWLVGAGATSASFGAGYVSAKDVNEVIYNWTSSSLMFDTPVDGNYGCTLSVGTADTAFSVEDYALSAASHGFDSATTNGYSSYSGGVWTVNIIKTFVNNSGASITIKEVGLFLDVALFTGASYLPSIGPAFESFLMARDVLGSPIVVADTESAVIDYAIELGE